MRILLLIALAGGLLWFFFRNPETTVSASEGAGEMLPMESERGAAAAESLESAPAQRPSGADEGDPAAASKPPETGAQQGRPADSPTAPPMEAAAKPAADERTAPTVAMTADTAAMETQLAALLFQDLARFEELVESGAGGLASGRLELARALARLVREPEEKRGALAEKLVGIPGVLPSEIEFVRQVGRPMGGETLLASVRPEGSLLQAARLALLVQDAERRIHSGSQGAGIDRLSTATIEALDGPWKLETSTLRRWTELSSRAARDCVWTPKGTWKGVEITVKPGDSLISIRKRLVEEDQELRVSTGLIARVNGIRGDRIHPGDVLRVPTEPVSMLVDLDSHWAFYLLGGRIVGGWSVGVGRQGRETQLGVYRVGDKRRDPMWFPAGQEPVPFGDPRNPLGTRWIELEHADGRASHLGFHGTNEPDSVGKDASEGCLRMLQADVEELFEILPAGVRVVIQG